MRKAFELGAAEPVPAPGAQAAAASGYFYLFIQIFLVLIKSYTGYLCLRPGDHLFARDRHGDLNPHNDVIRTWSVPM